MEQSQPVAVRNLLVSDVHLGCKHSRPCELLEFLRRFRPDSLYLVGDFIDGWKFNSGWYWSSDCDRVIAHLLDLAAAGTRIRYVPGNHDSFLRYPAFGAALGDPLSRFEVADEFVMDTQDGWRFLVTHGDRFDFFETRAQWASKGIGGFYDACLSVNWWVHRAILSGHRNPYGACACLKDRVKRFIRFISRFETKIMDHARGHACHGVICGHIHTPSIVSNGSVWYCNTGDWVENCTGLAEFDDGSIHLIRRYDADVVLRLPPRSACEPQEASRATRDNPIDDNRVDDNRVAANPVGVGGVCPREEPTCASELVV